MIYSQYNFMFSSTVRYRYPLHDVLNYDRFIKSQHRYALILWAMLQLIISRMNSIGFVEWIPPYSILHLIFCTVAASSTDINIFIPSVAGHSKQTWNTFNLHVHIDLIQNNICIVVAVWNMAILIDESYRYLIQNV